MKFVVALSLIAAPALADGVDHIPQTDVTIDQVLTPMVEAANLPDREGVYKYEADFAYERPFLSKNGEAISLHGKTYNVLEPSNLLDSDPIDKALKRIQYRENQTNRRLDILFSVIERERRGVDRGQYGLIVSLLEDAQGITRVAVNMDDWYDYDYLTDAQREALGKVRSIDVAEDAIRMELEDPTYHGKKLGELEIKLNKDLDMTLYHDITVPGVSEEDLKKVQNAKGMVMVGRYTGGRNLYKGN